MNNHTGWLTLFPREAWHTNKLRVARSDIPQYSIGVSTGKIFMNIHWKLIYAYRGLPDFFLFFCCYFDFKARLVALFFCHSSMPSYWGRVRCRSMTWKTSECFCDAWKWTTCDVATCALETASTCCHVDWRSSTTPGFPRKLTLERKGKGIRSYIQIKPSTLYTALWCGLLTWGPIYKES